MEDKINKTGVIMYLHPDLLANGMRENHISDRIKVSSLQSLFNLILEYKIKTFFQENFTICGLEKTTGVTIKYSLYDFHDILEELGVIKLTRGGIGESCSERVIKINIKSPYIVIEGNEKFLSNVSKENLI